MITMLANAMKESQLVGPVLAAIQRLGLRVKTQRALPNNVGMQLRFESGEILNVYNSGRIVPQGTANDQLRQAIQGLGEEQPTTVVACRNVFVVYGHDEPAKFELDATLRRWQLNPIILDQLPTQGDTIIEKLERYTAAEVGFGVVLATPDDEGYARGNPDERKFRVRQNVVLELGMLLTKLGRSRVAILVRADAGFERPSDIDGLIYIPYTNRISEVRADLVRELAGAGITVPGSCL